MSPDSQRCLAVVMPCFNEQTTIEEIVARVLSSPRVAELTIVDDASVDGTRETLEAIDDPRVRVLLNETNEGKGAAVRRGLRGLSAPYVIVQDADLEYDPQDFEQIVRPLLDDEADVVFGSRFQGGRPHESGLLRHSIGNKVLTKLSNMFTGLRLTDMATCYKAFRRELIESIEIEEDGFGVDPELAAKVAASGWRITEVPISYAARSFADGKKIRWRDGLVHIRCIVHYSRAARREQRNAGRQPSSSPSGSAARS